MSPRVRRSLRQVALPVLLAVVAASMVVVVATRDASPVARPTMPQAEATEPTDPEGPVATMGPLELNVSSYEVYVARDPFTPILPEDLEDADGGTAMPPGSPLDPGDPLAPGSPTSPDDDPTSPVSPSPGDDPNGSGDPGDPGGDGSSSEPECIDDGKVVCEGHEVSLADVFEDDRGTGAVVRVDDQLYEVADGDAFAEHFRVLSVDASCVTLQYGDDAFTLCEGESILK